MSERLGNDPANPVRIEDFHFQGGPRTGKPWDLKGMIPVSGSDYQIGMMEAEPSYAGGNMVLETESTYGLIVSGPGGDEVLPANKNVSLGFSGPPEVAIDMISHCDCQEMIQRIVGLLKSTIPNISFIQKLPTITPYPPRKTGETTFVADGDGNPEIVAASVEIRPVLEEVLDDIRDRLMEVVTTPGAIKTNS
ncbi:hypothetical protein HOG17_05020 [Candidatus Peregrinibacteria bacterium]|jgi:hypothetical protein|nr:hypothetical protein [Candidatus Peregrinibacteria bacterium]MBT4148500.1 hypothetical protein [Candidatus Peregrinibacteria bacterium]MBT4366719.1 hypothetical protein [Candidatus Peregrinibacteria bacterium]MBT4455512.1 hypothetical protein [Candidatus Peregrinibacteria bacterium]